MAIRLAVIGDPIEHSLSPVIHKAALDCENEAWTYEKIRVERGKLGEFLKNGAARTLLGFNVTMPHKVDIIPLLDGIDDEAKRFNSVNTVRVKDGRMIGFSTDGIGCSRAVSEHGRHFSDSRIVILGAGGAASCAALKAASEGAAAITVLNRTAAAAERLAKNVSDRCGFSVKTGGMTAEEMHAACAECDILINSTPLGMHGVDADFSDLSFLGELGADALVFDMIYNPSETRFLAKARGLGLDTMNGLDMLIYQGFAADEIFLEKKLDFAALKEKIELK